MPSTWLAEVSRTGVVAIQRGPEGMRGGVMPLDFRRELPFLQAVFQQITDRGYPCAFTTIAMPT